MAEFFVVVTRGEGPLLSIGEAAQQVDLLSQSFQTLNITPMIVMEAARGVQAHRLSYWEAQIWATARLNQIPVILIEDLRTGASFEGVHFSNPFATD